MANTLINKEKKMNNKWGENICNSYPRHRNNLLYIKEVTAALASLAPLAERHLSLKGCLFDSWPGHVCAWAWA